MAGLKFCRNCKRATVYGVNKWHVPFYMLHRVGMNLSVAEQNMKSTFYIKMNLTEKEILLNYIFFLNKSFRLKDLLKEPADRTHNRNVKKKKKNTKTNCIFNET